MCPFTPSREVLGKQWFQHSPKEKQNPVCVSTNTNKYPFTFATCTGELHTCALEVTFSDVWMCMCLCTVCDCIGSERQRGYAPRPRPFSQGRHPIEHTNQTPNPGYTHLESTHPTPVRRRPAVRVGSIFDAILTTSTLVSTVCDRRKKGSNENPNRNITRREND